jgi:hypothetical protein
MNGSGTWLAGRVASLVPKVLPAAAATACSPSWGCVCVGNCPCPPGILVEFMCGGSQCYYSCCSNP